MWKPLIVLSAIAAGANPAAAKWHEASSDHFIVYADQNEADIRDFTARLERFHNALSARLKIKDTKPSPSNRVTVYFVRNEQAVQKLSGSKSRNLRGFYIPRAGGSAAFVPVVDDVTTRASEDELVLLHEYAHHIMISNSAVNYPLWVTEGFAEFYSSAKFEKNGDVGLGLPAQHRAAELQFAKEVPIEQLLDTAAYTAKKTKQYDSFYGQSWTLYHYLSFDPNRTGQLSKYLEAIGGGQSEIEAARSVFGDLKQLDKDLDKYLRKKMLSYQKLSGEILKPGPIALRPLRAGEAAMMPVLMQSKRGVDSESAATLLPDARKIAAQFADDPAVLAALSEAEFDAGNDAQAIAAADKATALDPKQIGAIIQKGYAMARQAADAQDQKTAWKNVRKQFLLVNKIENDHPIPLIQFYQSYKDAGDAPTKNAIDGLEWALMLSPFDGRLRWTVATQQMEDEKFADVIATLGPLINNPHGEKYSDAVQKLMSEAKQKLAQQQKSAPIKAITP